MQIRTLWFVKNSRLTAPLNWHSSFFLLLLQRPGSPQQNSKYLLPFQQAVSKSQWPKWTTDIVSSWSSLVQTDLTLRAPHGSDRIFWHSRSPYLISDRSMQSILVVNAVWCRIWDHNLSLQSSQVVPKVSVTSAAHHIKSFAKTWKAITHLQRR